MKSIYLLLSLALLFTTQSLSAAEKKQSESLKSDKRDVEDFTKIHFTGKGNLYVQQGEHENVQVIAEEELMPYIKSEVVEGTLHIGEKGMGWFLSLKTFEPYNVYVTVKNIEEITMAGKGVLTAEKAIKEPSLKLDVSGSGKVDFAMEVENLSANIAGSGEYNLKGKADKQMISIAGSGTYNALKLTSNQAAVDIMGFGNVSLNVQEKLNVNISGKGTVTYMGKPVITQKILGTGRIEELK